MKDLKVIEQEVLDHLRVEAEGPTLYDEDELPTGGVDILEYE